VSFSGCVAKVFTTVTMLSERDVPTSIPSTPSVPGTFNCALCPPGQYSACFWASSCVDCPASRYSSSSGAVFCIDCAAGKYTEETGAIHSTQCEGCPGGRYSSAASSEDRVMTPRSVETAASANPKLPASWPNRVKGNIKCRSKAHYWISIVGYTGLKASLECNHHLEYHLETHTCHGFGFVAGIWHYQEGYWGWDTLPA
jgi:hypothetical protein